MKCVYCGHVGSRVVDSRQSEDGSSIRRRRECEKCFRRFTTFEKADTVPLMVIKKDKTRQLFDADKLRAGIIKACEKRPVSLMQLEQIVDHVEQKVFGTLESEVSSKLIGELVMEQLRQVDEVAYVRFACVYHQFRDLQTFVDELGRLISENQGNADDEVR